MNDRAQKKLEEYLAKAKVIHEDKYDYSLVEYKGCKQKVKIICPIHGVFEQTLDHHVNGRTGCPECRVDRIQATVRERYGVDYISQSEGFQERVEATNLEKYGVRRPMQGQVAQDKARMTSQEHWGTDYAMQSDEVVRRFNESARRVYGVDWPIGHPRVVKKIRATLKERYGVDNAMQFECFHDKAMATRLAEGSSCSSHSEDRMYAALTALFGVEDVRRQYKSEAYPFHCDFYIESLDLYMELNGFWVHGTHWFDEMSDLDRETLVSWLARAESGCPQYRRAIDTWTRRDPLKRQIAIVNDLNYVVFWNSNLTDFTAWLEQAESGNVILKQF